jgi:predicted RNA-binding Zn-ribbon protein involved in translation (DUF1610 family)
MIPASFSVYKANRDIIDEIDAAETEINRLRNVIKSGQGKLRFKCPECKKLSMLKDTDSVQHHYYIEPHGCTGGDYWNEDGVSWCCPKCGQGLKPDYKEREAWQSMSYYFKSKTDEHKH